MSNDLNQCQFIGRLGKDPETRYVPSGEAICNFSIAVGAQWKNKAGEKQEATEWVNITAFGKLAEICVEYLKKGSQVYINGRMKTEKFRPKMELIVIQPRLLPTGCKCWVESQTFMMQSRRNGRHLIRVRKPDRVDLKIVKFNASFNNYLILLDMNMHTVSAPVG